VVKYDGFDFNPYLHISNINRPLLPPQDIMDKTIIGRHGAYFLAKRHEPITISVEVFFHEDLELTFREKTRLIAGNLNKQEPKRLIFDDEPNVYIEGIIRDSTEINNLVKSGETTLNFWCPEPYYYEIEDEVFTFSGTGGYDFTREKGNVESFPRIEIDGTNSIGEIIIETDDTSITFDGNLESGETLVFDSKLITAYIVQRDGTTRSANDDIDTMDFPLLQVGVNHLDVSTTGNATVEQIRVYANSMWV